MTENPEASAAPAACKRALLIGIRTFPRIPEAWGQPLAGCHNDVARMREVLLGRGFADEHLRVLVDRLEEGCDCPFCEPGSTLEVGSPTRDGISAAVGELADAAGPEDVVVLYYSGHGSEFAGRGLHAGRRFQTLVPHDSGRGTHVNRDIADREIEGWIRAIHRRTPYLTMIFDCCHSGGMTDMRSEARVHRQVAADERDDAEALAPELRQVLEPATAEGGDREARGPTGWLRGAGRTAVVLSASAARELSSETVFEGRKQGLFTAQLTRALRGRATEGLTWADVFPEVAERVTAENLSQHPRREGNSPIFERGEIDPEDVYPPHVVQLKKLAVVIGIDYQRSGAGEGEESRPGFPPLATPARDAEEVARVLEEVQGFEVVGLSRKSPGPLLNEKATRRRIHKLIDRLISVKARAQRETAVVIYFAGHGVTRATEDGGHAGYLVPWEGDPDDPGTWLPMKDLRDQLVDGIRDGERLELLGQKKPLSRLTSRHLLLVLDCCFGGALSFDFFRGGGEADRPIYYSEYKRFVEGTAWQLLTSASFNQQAMDRNPKDPHQPHSPFALALIDGLTSSAADSFRQGSRSDQIVTAAELHQYVDARLKKMGVDVQTPGLMPLRPLEGQFIFHVPGFEPTPLPDPPLDPSADPWRGAKPYRSADADLFFGRELATLELLERFLEPRYPGAGDAEGEAGAERPLAVVGPSGSGKTSLVEAGLLPLLEEPVAARRRLQSWARRQGLRHLLVSREDLEEVRRWASDLALDVSWTCDEGHGSEERARRARELAERVRGWARGEGLLVGGEAGAARIRTRIQMRKLGVPSFTDGGGDARPRGWLERLAVIELLDDPPELAARLGLWLGEGGLADFLSVPERALARLVGRWTVVRSLEAAELAEASDGGGTLLWIDALEERAGEILDDAWKRFDAGDGRRTVAAVRADALSRDADLRRALHPPAPWAAYRVPRPGRDDLRQAVTGPAACRALVFEPPELVEGLVEEVAASPASLPLLSRLLSRAFERAWERRRDGDRQLLAADLGPGSAAGFLARRAEAAYGRLVREDPRAGATARRLLLRSVSFATARPAGRAIAWRELELTDDEERRRLETRVLPAFVREHLLVAGGDLLELAGEGLIGAWERLRRWIDEAAGDSARPETLWRLALEWEASGFDRRKLSGRDRSIRALFGSPALNRLERAFVVASEMEARLVSAQTLAAVALPQLFQDWPRSALLAAEAAVMAIDTRRVVGRLLAEPRAGADSEERCDPPWAEARKLALEARDLAGQAGEQALHDALAATPLSLPLAVPGGPGCRLVALAFRGADELRVRIAAPGAGSGGETQTVHAWDLRDLSREPRRLDPSEPPEPGGGQVKARRLPFGFVLEFPPVTAPRRSPVRGPTALAGHDNAVRYFPAGLPAPGAPPGSAAGEPRMLLGHRGVPSFLAISARRRRHPARWLASGSRHALGSEVRLWPIGEDGALPSEPRSCPGHRLEVTVAGAGGGSWRIEGVAPDGSSFVLRDPATGGQRSVELPRPRGSTPEIEEDDGDAAPDFHFSGDGRWLAAVSAAGTAWLWSLDDLVLRWMAGGPSSDGRPRDRVTCLAFNPAPGAAVLLAAGTESGIPWLVSAGASARRSDRGSRGRICALAFSPDGDRLALGSFDGAVSLIPARPGPTPPPVLLRGELRGATAVTALAFDPDGRRLRVERRRIYDLSRRQVDVYRLDLEELVRLARGHAGRGLEPADMPSELWLELFGVKPQEVVAEDPEKALEKSHERELYMATLVAPGTPPPEPEK